MREPIRPHEVMEWLAALLFLLAVMMMTKANAQDVLEVPPAEVHIRKGAAFSYERMNKLYFAACHEVTAEMWPDQWKHKRELMLRPKIVLEVGVEKDAVEIDLETGAAHIQMRKWADATFAYAVVLAAETSILSKERKRLLAKAAMQTANATISVEELKEGENYAVK